MRCNSFIGIFAYFDFIYHLTIPLILNKEIFFTYKLENVKISHEARFATRINHLPEVAYNVQELAESFAPTSDVNA